MKSRIIIGVSVLALVLLVSVALLGTKKEETVTTLSASQLLGEFNGSFYFVADTKLIRQSLSPKESEVIADGVTVATMSPVKTKIAYQSSDKSSPNRLTTIDLVNSKRSSYKNVINYAWHKNDLVMFSESGDETGYNMTGTDGKVMSENITIAGLYPTEKELLARTDLDPNVSDASAQDIVINSILPASNVATKLSGVASYVVSCNSSLVYRNISGQIIMVQSGKPSKALDISPDKPLVVCSDGGFYVLSVDSKNTTAEVLSVDVSGNTESKGFIRLSRSKFVMPDQSRLDGKVVFSNDYFYIASDTGIVRYKI